MQVTEPGTLIPLVLGATQVVLVGDHKQLGPCVSSIAAEAGLARSLFERLLQNGMTSHMLNVQYRMHPDIAKWPSNQYYEGKLRNGDNTLHLKGGQLGFVVSGVRHHNTPSSWKLCASEAILRFDTRQPYSLAFAAHIDVAPSLKM